MTSTNQLEMKLHEQATQISQLKYQLAELKEQLEKSDAILKNLCERLYVQG